MSAVDIATRDAFEAASAWWLRLAEGDLDAESQAQFEAWLGSNPRHPEALERVYAAWEGLDQVLTTPDVMAMRTQALETVRRANRLRWTRLGGRRWSAAAAVVIVLIGAALVAARLSPTTYRTVAGQRQVVTLTDGSRLSLDGDTQVDVRLGKQGRELWLKHGRARFKVAKDPLRPFTVTVGDRTVVATGTAFSVELINRDINVVLYEGHVAVVAAAAVGRANRAPLHPEATLAPGQQMQARLGGTADDISTADLNRSAAWERGQLVFDNEPLVTAVERVNRYSDKKIKLADARVEQVLVNGVFDAGDTQAFITGVTNVLPVRVENSEENWIFSRK
jgi:transmembrane sensor